jgi:hypothetical protein
MLFLACLAVNARYPLSFSDPCSARIRQMLILAFAGVYRLKPAIVAGFNFFSLFCQFLTSKEILAASDLRLRPKKKARAIVWILLAETISSWPDLFRKLSIYPQL